MFETSTKNNLWQAYWIWFLGALFYGYEVCLQVSPSVMVNELMHTFHIHAAMVGNLAAFYFYSYTIMQIPSGLMLDKWGPRRMMLCAFLMCALGAFVFGSAASLFQAKMGRLMIGFGSSFAIVGTFKIISIWFPSRQFSLMSALTVTIGMLGAMFAGGPLALTIEHIGWRQSMFIFTLVGMILFLLAWFSLLERPSQLNLPNQFFGNTTQTEKDSLSLLTALVLVIKKSQNWVLAFYGGLMFTPTSAFAGLWGVSFLMTAYHLSKPLAGYAVSLIFLGWIIGGPTLGKISDYFQTRKKILFCGTLGAIISFYQIVYVNQTLIFLYLWLFVFGFCSSGFLPSFSIIQEINSQQSNATALGYMNTMNMIGGAILQPLIGYLLELHWNGKIINHLHVYDVTNFRKALLIILIMLITSFILYFFIEEPQQLAQ